MSMPTERNEQREREEHNSEIRWLRSVARRLIGPKLRRWVDSVDLVQDALLVQGNAPRSVANGPDGVRRRWLERVMGNLAKRYARRRDLQLSRSGGWSDLPESGQHPGARILARERGESLRRRLGRLDDRTRKVILMRVVDDKPFAVVAKGLGITEQNARVIFHRGLQRLREQPDA